MWMQATGRRVIGRTGRAFSGEHRTSESVRLWRVVRRARGGARRGRRRARPSRADSEGLLEARMVGGGLSQCRPAVGSAGT